MTTAAATRPAGMWSPAASEVVDPSHAERLRLAAISVALVVLAFAQQPGLIVADTKLDLVVDPWRFLAKSLHFWEPIGFSGQLQNQAYGYLFPMGPFFGVVHTLRIHAWVGQRLWWAVLLLVAFHGMRRLIKALEVGTAGTAVVGALAFTLSARFVTVIGAVSVEVWPMAVAPWVLLPLVTGSRSGSERRAAGWSGFAAAFLGGVNAVATGAVLILPLCWLLTREPGPRRRRLLLWWAVFTAAAISWWVLPLLLLGRYSPPFLDWIESSATTTAPMSLVNVVRGTTHWIAYLNEAGSAIWPAGRALVTEPVVILNAMVIAIVGVAGLALPRLPHRRFLVGTLLLGLLVMTLGHDGPWSPPWWESAQQALDGPLSPMRNLHKFQVLVTLPLAVGLAHLLAELRPRGPLRWPRAGSLLVAATALVVVAAAAPAVVGGLPQQGAFAGIPGYWRQTADWLAAQDSAGQALVLPGAKTPDSLWGNPHDEPLQPLARSAWTVRDSVPLSSAGNIRVLDAVEQVVDSGQGSPGLSSFLARAGIEYVVVRNDLDWARTFAPPPGAVLAALDRSGGFVSVAAFGPMVGSAPATGGLVVADGLPSPVPTIQIFRVSAYAGPVQVVPVAQVPTVVGGPESLLPLVDSHLIDAQPTVLAPDRPAGLALGPTIVTDGMRRSEVDFGGLHGNRSATMTADQPFVRRRAVHDYLPFPTTRRQTVAVLTSGSTVSASTSAADVGGWTPVDQSAGPYSAFDEDPRTRWRPQDGVDPVGQWVQVTWAEPRLVSGVALRLWNGSPGRHVSQVEVTTDRGSRVTMLGGGSDQQWAQTADGPTTTVRVTVLGVVGPGIGQKVGIASVTVPGPRVTRSYAVPPAPGPPAAETFAFSAAPSTDGCLVVEPAAGCSRSLIQVGEEDAGLDRTFTVAQPESARATGWLQPRGGPALDRLLMPTVPALTATASSTLTPSPSIRPQAAVDRELGTTWIAGASDAQPRLTLQWPRAVSLSTVRLLLDPAADASRPRWVVVTAGKDAAGVRVEASGDGVISFPAVRTRRLSLVFEGVRPRPAVDPVTGSVTALPVGVSEVRTPGASDSRRTTPVTERTGLPCGFAPTLYVDGVPHLMRADGTIADLLTGRGLSWRECSSTPVELTAGRHEVQATSTVQMQPIRLVLATGADVVASPTVTIPQITQWSTQDRELDLPAHATSELLVVHENANVGWQASALGRPLQAVRVDGWQQGWLVPAGVSGPVHLVFTPDRTYRWALLVGLLLGACLLVALLIPGASRSPAAEDRSGSWRWWVMGGAALGLIAWWVGLVAVVLLGGLAWRQPRVRRSLAVVSASVMVAAAALVVGRPSVQLGLGPAARVVELLMVIAVAALWATGVRSRHERAEPQSGALESVPAGRGRGDGE
jgi:arabinofuranan 3-O-arabinosyltransferase